MRRIYGYIFFTLLLSIGLPAQADSNLLYELGEIDNNTPFTEIPLVITEGESNVSIDMRATSGDLDTLVFLVDENGNILAQNSDRADGVGNDTDSFLNLRGLPIGDYRIIASREGVENGFTAGAYEAIVVIEPTLVNNLDYDVTAETLTEIGYPELPTQPTAEWTIMAFYGADTNLEAALLNDINEFELAGGSDEQIRVIALVDRHPEHDSSNDDWTTTRIFEVSNNVTDDAEGTYPPQIDSVTLADLGELDTGDGEVLAQFLTWALRTYPANHYAISIGSHGAGWQGLSTDETTGAELGTDPTIISLPELTKALDITKEIAGVDKFDLMINDACLMSSVEYHSAVSDYFNLTLASPEITVNPALDMTLFTDVLRNQGDADLITLGDELVNKYINEDMFTRGTSSTEYYTFSLVDLQNYDTVIETINSFAEYVNKDPARYAELLGEARANVYTYSAFMGGNTLVDIGHLMEQIIILARDVDLIEQAQEVLTTIEATRIYGNAGERASRLTSYFNVYFPENSNDFEQDYFEQSPLTEWGNMLRNYYNLQTPRSWLGEDSLLTYHPPTAPNVKVTQVFPISATLTLPPTIKIEIEGRRISRGTFTVDLVDEERDVAVRLLSTPILQEIVVGNTQNFVNRWRSGVDRSNFSWLPMTLPVVTDGETSENELLIRSGDTAILEGRYKEPDGRNWNDVAVFFSIEKGTVQRVISRAKGSGAVAEVLIPEGSLFQSYRQYVKPDGRSAVKPGTSYMWGANGLTWSDEVAPNGKYRLGFLVEAQGGTAGFDSAEINVNNDTVIEGRRGFLAINLGLSFSHPEEWITPLAATGFIQTVNDDLTQSISVISFPAQTENIFQIAENYQRKFGYTPIGEPEQVELGRFNIPAVQFDYSYELDGATWYGRAYAMYRLTARRIPETSIIYAVEAQTEDDLTALFDEYKSTLRFFDAVALQARAENRWRYRQFKPGILYPVPKGWIREGDIASGSWRTVSNPDEPEINAQITFFEETEDVDGIIESLRGDILPDEFEVVPYDTTRRRWKVVPFEFERDGQTIISRVYFAKIQGEVYVIKFETPDDGQVVERYRNRFELMIDGFAPLSNQRYALGDTNPTLLKANMSSALETCDVDLENVACYGQGNLIAFAEDEDALSEEGDFIGIDEVDALSVGFENEDDDSFDSFSIAIIEPEITQANGETATITIGVFGGVSVETDYIEIEAAESDE